MLRSITLSLLENLAGVELGEAQRTMKAEGCCIAALQRDTLALAHLLGFTPGNPRRELQSTKPGVGNYFFQLLWGAESPGQQWLWDSWGWDAVKWLLDLVSHLLAVPRRGAEAGRCRGSSQRAAGICRDADKPQTASWSLLGCTAAIPCPRLAGSCGSRLCL